ncbi:MAG: cupin domain-containing protein [Solirubrobacteraceae bacterium]
MTVVHTADVPPRPVPNGLRVAPMLGEQTGFDPLAQAVLECPPGTRTQPFAVDGVQETMFVLSGRGRAHIGDDIHELEPETALALPPGTELALETTGTEPLRIVAVRIPDPEPEAAPRHGPALSRLAEQTAGQATAQREFRILADPATGLSSATHFVGYIPTARAPDHYHHYDEVIYVLDGEGVMHAGADERPLSAGSCIQLPARTVHCLENTGAAPMRVVAVFRPAGSPAEAYYPDGTPAYQGDNEDQLQRRSQQP